MLLDNSVILAERYSIESTLNDTGPLDFTYRARDIITQRAIAIREYFPVDISHRSAGSSKLKADQEELFEYGLSIYTLEANTLSRIHHPNLVHGVISFRENETAYCAYDLIQDIRLDRFIQQRGEPLTEAEALPIILSILDALKICHEHQLFHGAISPKSVYLSPSNQPMLLDFRMASIQLAQLVGNVKDIRVNGCSAPEILDPKVDAGPWWDIYGSAATLYFMLTGQLLPSVITRNHHARIDPLLKKDPRLSPTVRDALKQALAFDPEDRIPSAQAFIDLLSLSSPEGHSFLDTFDYSTGFDTKSLFTHFHGFDSILDKENKIDYLKLSTDYLRPQSVIGASNIISRPHLSRQRLQPEQPFLNKPLQSSTGFRVHKSRFLIAGLVLIVIGLLGGYYIRSLSEKIDADEARAGITTDSLEISPAIQSKKQPHPLELLLSNQGNKASEKDSSHQALSN